MEIASTPESATAPDEKARRSANRVTPVSSDPFSVTWLSASWFTGRASRFPKNERNRPTPISAVSARTYTYVGPAKSRPDSFTPRRLPTVMRPTKKMHIGTRMSWVDGNAEVMAATPAETDTATVST